mmetsp:Transcript_47589/g.110227  ORF Transcript_47589/g.110227 Transcript_47589/m.110227 type:complete len:856 (+) Transcript_47589:51-2618(+)|eukprot:CAMPEP_0171075456 /NCGR_PEP_ID=MMETSP0766_2-20121228/12785_1 /TAXON_ID=439317 /ORGANISM="Gambierdiscus australes, Strain CAWD 149" /LENGTH=855 /DNA_ID=CAMNT_0011532325 /DNA_START=42 /DNA_END=2609 /DNA_ORIENTATION=-
MQAFGFLIAVLLPLCVEADEDKRFHGDVRIGEEKLLKSQILDLQWLGEDRNVVLLRTQGEHLHRSENGGETWTDLQGKFSRSGAASNSSTFVPIKRLVRSAADLNTVFAEGPGEDHFVSVDSGVTWERVLHAGTLQGFLFHNTRKTWALLSCWTDGCRPSPKAGEICSHNLYLTKDLGKTFTLVQTHIVQFSWGKREFKQDDRVYFTHFRNKSIGQRRLVRWMEGVDFVFTEDLEREKPEAKILVPGGNKFQISNGYILVVKVKDPIKQNVSLMISSDGAQTFSPALLPHRLWQHSFALLDASEGALVLHVNQGTDRGDVYISDKSGKNFSTSLERNVRINNICAFEKVMNLNGVFIANVFEGESDSRPAVQEEQDPEEVEKASTGSQTEALTEIRWRRLEAAVAACPGGEVEGLEGCPPEAQSEHLQRVRRGRAGGARPFYRRLGGAARANNIRTVISFDAGATWNYLDLPQNSQGKNFDCNSKKRCFLHLHDFTDLPDFAPVYSYKNAVGILMGTGNVGTHLSFKREDTSTFLSRDGGRKWLEVHNGTFIYEFGDYGGLLVMADMVHETTTALFSWNEGKTWMTFKIADKPMKVDNIIIEPNATSTVFLIYGHRNGVGISRFLDFSKVHNRSCDGVKTPSNKDSDYEHWRPPSCLEGEHRVYTRRKQTAKCFNNFKDRYHETGPCNCTKRDYECEVGFERDVGGRWCRETSESALRRGVMSGCVTGQRVAVLQYRKVPGNKCVHGWHPEPIYLNCTNGFAPQNVVPVGRAAGRAADTADRAAVHSSLAFQLTFVLGTLVCGALLTRSQRVRQCLERVKARPRVPPAASGTRIGREMDGLAVCVDQQQGYLRYE